MPVKFIVSHLLRTQGVYDSLDEALSKASKHMGHENQNVLIRKQVNGHPGITYQVAIDNVDSRLKLYHGSVEIPNYLVNDPETDWIGMQVVAPIYRGSESKYYSLRVDDDLGEEILEDIYKTEDLRG